ncbi:GH32 C-terminal domain-containing protein [Streptomyces stelliscabiei]|uniref:GH32 C-terminal domain-containing protein n=1 Tax=Streptomyces stelliscabiei TaxID=146820 RepID=UPI0029A92641|nr:GH32 C-terminal domain-containing protein [Streptomyces stelliscabiei]MDX2550483.1 GH32 C-terminal domain-containing protein [Streptomyces stelliscabiei]MDX2610181.1 GH32 C-terminal domain-containing protein [Streptomyces stelliscabiei]MDX2634898.1 GH32 C-terminal domain-containing protein [Streptomyces stelliscabiei]MDX2659844.1 GH32 C-terminal domain-containing protein [Streptomyces stelliscabiei]MDX2711463.1 GH32 C-terminal domain-containing protein [Streptomyces stelliscabiei]
MRSGRVSRHARTRMIAAAATVCVLSAAPLTPPAAAAGTAPYSETYRPQFHFTPEKNWMNDPNGLVYYKGEYHLFYQYNPNGNSWGDMSWGHAVSTDLMHWTELPLALSHDDEEMVFSGSAVVDEDNTTGFGTKKNPPMVAVYTSLDKATGIQSQSLAHSTDRGRTWTKYQGNPVLDIGSKEFRDPKVQWYAPTKSWLMTVSLSTEHKVRFYSSKNLKDWTQLSEFGPAGATGGVWECPDLFPLAVDGDKNTIKWVLVVNINPGGIAGGSAAQYFIGDFDGTKFTAEDDGVYTPPAGTVVQDFEGTGFGSWTATGTAFGPGPAAGTLDGQQTVSGFDGKGLANSFHSGDATTGTLTSPSFTVDSPYLNFKIGGGRHPHQPGKVLAGFEGGTYGDWTTTGDAFGPAPATGTLPGQQQVSGFQGSGLVNTFLNGDGGTGTLTSPEFTIDKRYVNFLIGGGNHPAGSADPTALELLVDGQVVRSTTGKDAEELETASWDVHDLAGKKARIRVVDDNTGGWGHLNVDQITLSDTQAQPGAQETSVSLIVDGQVVRSATGADSETLDWASFDMRPYLGRKAQIQLVDMNTGGWGHILADRFTAADAPALSVLRRAHWADYGKDYYAAVSWENTPGSKRHMIGWMSNWDYAGATPTSPWRGAQSIPREMALRTVDGRVRLTSEPVNSVKSLRQEPPATATAGTVTNTSKALIGPAADGKALDIEATFSLKDAERFGLKVRTGTAGEETVIGYDTTTQELYVDRTRSGAVNFNSTFPGIQTAPLKAANGKIRLRILVDWSSVEVFGGDGEAVITDQIFPDPASQGVQVFAENGSVKLDKATVWHLTSAHD